MAFSGMNMTQATQAMKGAIQGNTYLQFQYAQAQKIMRAIPEGMPTEAGGKFDFGPKALLTAQQFTGFNPQTIMKYQDEFGKLITGKLDTKQIENLTDKANLYQDKGLGMLSAQTGTLERIASILTGIATILVSTWGLGRAPQYLKDQLRDAQRDQKDTLQSSYTHIQNFKIKALGGG
jgi:hypothetical protein